MGRSIEFGPKWETLESEAAKVKEAEAKGEPYSPMRAETDALDLETKTFCMDLLSEPVVRFGTLTYARLRGGLKGLQPFPYPIELDRTGKPTDQWLAKIPWQKAVEIAERIWKRSTLSEDDLKNSGGPSA